MRPTRLEMLVNRWRNADKAMAIIASVGRRRRTDRVEKAYEKAKQIRRKAEQRLIRELLEDEG